jgi:fructose 1,6-bisphosphate aldolase/phosphatase
MLVRVQGSFPATGEVLAPFTICHYVAGFMRGSHTGPLMPVKRNTSVSFFDGPPIVSCMAFCVHEGKFTHPADAFDHPYWDYVRDKASRKAYEIREQGFSGAAPCFLALNLNMGGTSKRWKNSSPSSKFASHELPLSWHHG